MIILLGLNTCGRYATIHGKNCCQKHKYQVFNLMSRTFEIRHIKSHETCKRKCRLTTSICNNKQCWNNNKSRCECKELIDRGICDKGFIWNSSN